MRVVLAFWIAAVSSVCACAQEITVAAASDLQFAMPQLVRSFEQQTGSRVRVSYGSSGNFFSQIQSGAPFDVYFSADKSYPQKLEEAGLAEPGTLRRYASGTLVLWVRNESPLDLSQGLRVLTDSRVRRIAMANPAHAPYGRAAMAAMQSEKISEQVAGKLVLGENISQTAQFVETGNADVGVIALSLAMVPAMTAKGRYAELHAAYPPLEQVCVAMKNSREKATARKFIDYVTGDQGKRVLAEFGFKP